MPLSSVLFDESPFRFSGNVYGTLLNDRDALAALGAAASAAPYKAPPKAVVMYVKPRNTLAGPGDEVEVPSDATELEVGANLGLVIGRVACRVSEDDALAHVCGYVIVNDVSVPHATFYRPSIRFKARDGYCPLGPAVVPRHRVPDPDRLAVRVSVDGRLVQSADTGRRIRPAARLLAEVSDFMTLMPGDVLMTGTPIGAPRVRPGQRASIEIEGLGRLENDFIAARGGRRA